MKHDDILATLKSGQVQPVYFLHGPESYFIDLVADYAESNLLSEAEQSFNLTILYGKDTEFITVLDAARRYPMMAPRQVVILKEAQDMSSLPQLQAYILNPTPTTALFICHKHKKFTGNTAFLNAVKANAVVLEAEPIKDRELPGWIEQYLKVRKFTIRPAALSLIAEYLGSSLAKVANELDKLAINLSPGTEINETHIEANIGISKDYNMFELNKALGERDIKKAGRIIQYFGANPKSGPLIPTLGMLFSYFTKVLILHHAGPRKDDEMAKLLDLRGTWALAEYRTAARHYPAHKATQIIGLLHEYDLKAKGVDYTGTDENELLRELVWKILH
jgi:DNA polymerase III subunit delta